MGLLIDRSNEKLTGIARKVFNEHFKIDPKLDAEYDDRRKMLMYEDILYNLGFLHAAIEFDEDRIFIDYAVWVYHLLCNLMKDMGRERIKDQMVTHYRILLSVLEEVLPENEALKAGHHLRNAMDATERESVDFTVSNRFETGGFQDIKREYLGRLMKNDTHGAIGVIEAASGAGINLNDIYINVMQEVMVEVGDLWHRNVITVDKEHYCTATTQVILSHFYPVIFSTPRNGHKILSCCVGSELHEMGMRMLSDLFEYRGWDSVYLGAAVPKDAILHAISENQPDLVALSVTMPQHLSLCHEIVQAVRERYGDIMMAVGGRAFQMTDQLWKKWNVDISTENAAQLVEWADRTIVNRGGR
jgi:MerR family transcriptional regulator, light-induced transcriptional regulator